MNYQININENSFNLDETQLSEYSIIKHQNGFHILRNNQAFHAKVIATNFQKKTATIEVNGNKYELKIADEYDQLIKKMGLSAATTQKMGSIKAPMPGLILDILVKVGQEVEKGTQLLILEAMKMENILKAEGEGIVKSIEIKKGDAVEKNQILIEME